jgi:hypothetical protein
MKLEDILSITSESTNIYIHQEDKIVSFYDGKNSIDNIYNECEIVTMWTESNGLHIEIVTD